MHNNIYFYDMPCQNITFKMVKHQKLTWEKGRNNIPRNAGAILCHLQMDCPMWQNRRIFSVNCRDFNEFLKAV